MPHIYIAAAHKSSGKTSISIGLTAALSAKSIDIQTFKKGPDYIDPLWLTRASGKPCYNLDFNTHEKEGLLSLFGIKASEAEFSIIEGNKGLYDGLDLLGSDSNAAMAKLLNAPVVLTIDTVGITRGIAPLLQGYQHFDPDINIAGVILNKVGSSRHQSKLIAAIEHYTDLPVLGAIGYDKSLEIPERHLGLVPANESSEAAQVVARLSSAVANNVDLNKLLKIGNSKNIPDFQTVSVNKITNSSEQIIKIAIAKDPAFGFYYADDLEAFASAGAELIPFNCLEDEKLPAVDGLFIGGGFPETQMEKLAANQSLLNDIKQKIEFGLPTYAECGGLMYLAQNINWQNETYPMVGVIPGSINVHKKPQGRGYVKLESTPAMPWTNTVRPISAHEFHYASLDELPEQQSYAYKVKRGSGINGSQDGIIIHNLLAGFAHLRNSISNPWVNEFVQFIRNINQ